MTRKIKRFNENDEIEFKQASIGGHSLKMKIQTTHVVDSRDLKSFVDEIYGGYYDFDSDVEARNDSSHTFKVDGVIDDEDKADVIREIKTSGDLYPDYCSNVLLNCLAMDGHIPKGNYVIKVCW